METYDVAIIGSGPGGYVAAIRCSQLGMRTALIEKYNSLGGTCTNVGCIPSKALLDSSEHYYHAKFNFSTHGIELADLKVNLKQMMARKDLVVKQNNDGIQYLMKKNKITVYRGIGSFVNKETLLISGENKTEIKARNVVIATGSKPSSLKGILTDKKRIITSTEALKLTEIPRQLIIIGGGVIGLEMGSVYARLGSKVTVIEYTDSIIGNMDRSLGKELQKVLTREGFEFLLQHKVISAVSDGKNVTVAAENINGKKITLQGDYCLLSTGRSPYTENLAIEKAGIQADEKGRITVNENLETQVKGIYAIGDVIRGPMLAHKAEEEGIFVAEKIVGQKPHLNYLLIPGVVYTWPEVASVGYTEEELKEKKINYNTGSFPFKASGRARASMDTDGFIKVLADKKTDEILGVHMIGPRVADVIAEAVVAMEFRSSAEDIARMSHAHPTYTEVFKEACLMATGNRALHL